MQGKGDVVVVGGGAIGLACAWRLARAGLAVVVVDPAPGLGASWAAAGMLAPVTEVHDGEEALLRLNLASLERWPAFAAALIDEAGRDPGFVRCGAVAVARDADDAAALRHVQALQDRLGLEVSWLTSRELRRLEPGLHPGVRGGLRVDGDHQVDNRALVEALRAAADAAGVAVAPGRVAEVVVAGDRVRGVRTDAGEQLAAGAVVLAAGAGSGLVGGLPPELVPPVRPVKGQLLHLRSRDGRPLARRIVRGLEVYVVPRPDGRVVVGATMEERGFDVEVTAGAVHDLLRAARELLPEVAELAFVEAVAGLRPGSPDNAPIIGPCEGVDGLVFATGHHRNGILLTPITADLVARAVVGGGAAGEQAPFVPSRMRRHAATSGGARR